MLISLDYAEFGYIVDNITLRVLISQCKSWLKFNIKTHTKCPHMLIITISRAYKVTQKHRRIYRATIIFKKP